MKYAFVALAVISAANARAIERRQFGGTFTVPAGVNVPPGFLPPGVTLVNAPAGAAATRAPVPPVSQTLGISGSNFGFESAFPAAGAPKPKPTANAPSPVAPAPVPPVSQTLSISGSTFTFAPAFDGGVGRREPQFSGTFTVPAGVNVPPGFLPPGVTLVNAPAGAAATRAPVPPVSQTLGISGSNFGFESAFPAAGAPKPKPTANAPSPVAPAPVPPVSQTLSISGSSFTFAPSFDAGVGRREPQFGGLPKVTLVPGVNTINIPAATRVPRNFNGGVGRREPQLAGLPRVTLVPGVNNINIPTRAPVTNLNPKPTANVPAPAPAQPQTPAASDADDEDAKQEAQDDAEDAKNDHDEEKADALEEQEDI